MLSRTSTCLVNSVLSDNMECHDGGKPRSTNGTITATPCQAQA